MAQHAGAGAATPPDPRPFLIRSLSRLRWATIAVLVLIALARPAAGRYGTPMWALLLLFAGYNLLNEALRRRLPTRHGPVAAALLDLPVVGLLYFLGGQPGGLLFVLFFVAVDSAAVSMALRGTLLYTAAAAAAMLAIDLPGALGGPAAGDLAALGARVVTLAMIGALVAVLTGRLALEHAAAQANRDAAERLAALDRVRNDFLATVSHDLRTPLTAARTALGLIEASAGDRLRADERALIENGRRNVTRLTLLIDDLLALSQLDAGTLRLEREPLDLRTVADNVARTLQPLILDKGQTFELRCPEPLPTLGDARRLEQAIENLVVNAHRHTPTGARIALHGWTSEEGVRLAVIDNGPGVPLAEREAIFARFHRLPGGHDGGGAGLGLAIARGIIELHGGRIWVEDAPGGGAAFQVALPRAAQREER